MMQSNINELVSRIIEQQEREQLTQLINEIAGCNVLLPSEKVDIISKVCLAMVAQMKLRNRQPLKSE